MEILSSDVDLDTIDETRRHPNHLLAINGLRNVNLKKEIDG